MGEVKFSNFRKSINGDQLRCELGKALTIPDPYVDTTATTLTVVGQVDEANRPQIESVLDAHTPDPDWGMDPDLKEIRALGNKASKSQGDIHRFMTLVAKRLR